MVGLIVASFCDCNWEWRTKLEGSPLLLYHESALTAIARRRGGRRVAQREKYRRAHGYMCEESLPAIYSAIDIMVAFCYDGAKQVPSWNLQAGTRMGRDM